MHYLIILCSTFMFTYGQDVQSDKPKIDIIIVDLNGLEQVFLENLRGSDVTLTELAIQTAEADTQPVLQSSYQLRCTASFPILMDYEGEGMPGIHVSNHRSLINATKREFQDEKNNQFEIRLHFSPKESNSGKYICQGVAKSYEDNVNYVYLFIPGVKIFIAAKPEHLGVLTHLHGDNQIKFQNETWDKIFFEANRPKSIVTIPCATSTESVKVHLFEQVAKGSETVTKNITRMAKFDPKQGFLLTVENKLNDTRYFLCHGFDFERRLNKTIAYSLHPLFQNRSISVKYSGTPDGFKNTFTCSVNPINTPVYFGRMDCFSHTHCKLMERRLRKSFLPRKMQSESGNFSLKYITVSINLEPEGNAENDYVSLRTDVLHVSGIFFCSYARNSLSTLVYNSFQHKIATAPGTESLDKPSNIHDILHIFKMEPVQTTTSNHNGEITSLKFSMICIGRSFFYIHGFLWKLEMEDGSVEFHSGKENYGRSSAYIRSKLALDSNRAKKVKNITCYAPEWNSYAWDSSFVEIKDLFLSPNATTDNEMELDYSHISISTACSLSSGYKSIIASTIIHFSIYSIINNNIK